VHLLFCTSGGAVCGQLDQGVYVQHLVLAPLCPFQACKGVRNVVFCNWVCCSPAGVIQAGWLALLHVMTRALPIESQTAVEIA
jgi:hypothetical protein